MIEFRTDGQCPQGILVQTSFAGEASDELFTMRKLQYERVYICIEGWNTKFGQL